MRRVHIEKEFEYKGFKCLVTLMIAGHRCGYVNVKNTKFEGVDYDYLQYIDVHGGLTYSDSKMHDREESEGDWWIGWDYAHCGDGKDFDAVKEVFQDDADALGYIKVFEKIEKMNDLFLSNHVATTEDVERDCMRVVDQIIELENKKKCNYSV